MDIATLGLAIDSSQVTTAASALDRLTAAANPAAAAANNLQKAASGVSSTTAGVAAAADKHAESLRGQRLVLRGLVGDLALFGSGLSQAGAIAATLYIENAHLFEGFGGLKSAIGSLITPTNLLIGGFAAVAVGGYLVYSSLKQSGTELGNLSERTMTAVSSLHSLESALAVKGITGEDFNKSITQFGTLTREATANLGSLAELFQANGVAAGTLDENLARVADLIRNARDEADKYRLIQLAGLPPTREWVNFLSQGAEGIKRARAEGSRHLDGGSAAA